MPIGQNELMLASYLHRIKSGKLTLQDLMKNILKHEIYRYMGRRCYGLSFIV